MSVQLLIKPSKQPFLLMKVVYDDWLFDEASALSLIHSSICQIFDVVLNVFERERESVE